MNKRFALLHDPMNMVIDKKYAYVDTTDRYSRIHVIHVFRFLGFYIEDSGVIRIGMESSNSNCWDLPYPNWNTTNNRYRIYKVKEDHPDYWSQAYGHIELNL